MILLCTYLGSVVYSLGTFALMSKLFKQKLKKLGYKEESNYFFKNLGEVITTSDYILIVGVPIFNFVFTTYLVIDSDILITNIIRKGVMDGSLVKIEEPIIEKNIKEETKIISYNVNKELSNEEKIEFLKQELSRLTGKDIPIKEKKGRQKRR